MLRAMGRLLLRRVGIPSSLDHRQSFTVLDYHLRDCDRRPAMMATIGISSPKTAGFMSLSQSMKGVPSCASPADSLTLPPQFWSLEDGPLALERAGAPQAPEVRLATVPRIGASCVNGRDRSRSCLGPNESIYRLALSGMPMGTPLQAIWGPG
jgi:hypothetical protein